MNDDLVQKTIEQAKQNLAQASNTTQTVVGNPTQSFQPTAFPMAKYKIARAARKQ